MSVNQMKNRTIKNTRRHQRQRGFTLIEIAIVLVIIGLLIGGVMQGQSLIRAAKVKDIITTATDLSGAAATFKTRYHVLPGDHPAATTEIPGAVGNGNGNGVISVAESANVPSHLFASGFIKGGATAPIRTTYGAVWLVQRSSAITAASPCGAAVNNAAPALTINNVIVFSTLPGDAAEEIDRKLDDGLFNSGTIRGSAAYSNSTVQCIALPL